MSWGLAVAAACGAAVLLWATVKGAGTGAAVASGLAEFILAGLSITVLVRHAERLNRRGGASFRLSLLVSWLFVTAACVPVFWSINDTSDLSPLAEFVTTFVVVPALIAPLSGVALARGWRTGYSMPECSGCGAYASPRAHYCMSCGSSLRS